MLIITFCFVLAAPIHQQESNVEGESKDEGEVIQQSDKDVVRREVKGRPINTLTHAQIWIVFEHHQPVTFLLLRRVCVSINAI